MNDHYFSIFSSSGLYPQVFWQVKEWLIVALRDERATCSCVLNGFYEFALCRSAVWSAKTYGKWSFSGIFSRLIPFPQVFGQVKEWIMIELHQIIRLPHIVAFPIVFILFYKRDSQGGVFKVIKNDHFLVFLVVWGLIPKFLGRLRSDLF